MKPKCDPSKSGNQRGISIQHYLIEMIHRILEALDNNSKGEKFAVFANLINWNNTFPWQCAQLGIESFVQNGVRPSLFPVLLNYFQGREMSVKWHGCRLSFCSQNIKRWRASRRDDRVARVLIPV